MTPKTTFQTALLPLALAAGLLASAPAEAAIGAKNPDIDPLCQEFLLEHTMLLDSTGISSWRFLNARRPYPVVQRKKRGLQALQLKNLVKRPEVPANFDTCVKDAIVDFVNTSPAEAFVVTIPYTFGPAGDPSSIVKRFQDASRRLGRKAVCDPALTGGVKLACETARDFYDDFKDSFSDPKNTDKWPGYLDVVNDLLYELSSEIREVLAEATDKKAAALLAQLSDPLTRVEQALAALASVFDPAADAQDRVNALYGEAQRLRELETKAGSPCAGATGDLGRVCNAAIQIGKDLDGAFPKPADRDNWPDYLAKLDDALAQVPDDNEEEKRRLEIPVVEELIEQLIFAFEDPPVSECPEPLGASQTCNHVFLLEQNARLPISPPVWRRLIRQSDGILTVKVAFFDEATAPGNAEGYLQVRREIEEPASETSLSVIAQATYRQEPQTSTAAATPAPLRFSPTMPYSGDTLRRFPAQARIELTQTLGARGRARVVGRFKNADLGGQDENDLSVSQWQADFFSLSGAALRFGEFAFATPASGIAINERLAEGYSVSFRSLSIGHIIKRESLGGFADDADRDSEAVILQLRGLRLPLKKGDPPKRYLPFIQHLDLYWLDGEQNPANRRPYDYSTYGGELFWAANEKIDGDTDTLVSGSFSYFSSEREMDAGFVPPDPPDPLPADFMPFQDNVFDGRGRVWLAEVGLNRVKVKKAAAATGLRSLSLRIGDGSGDKPGTANRDEGYLGETAGFAPDQIFLGRFAGRFRENDEEATLPLSTLAGGLSNKRYYGLTYVERAQAKKLSPLHAVARALGARKPTDITSETLTLRLHNYRLHESVLGRHDAGWELGVEWFLQAPRGVRTTLSWAKYFPGDALEPFFADDPTLVQLTVAMTLQ